MGRNPLQLPINQSDAWRNCIGPAKTVSDGLRDRSAVGRHDEWVNGFVGSSAICAGHGLDGYAYARCLEVQQAAKGEPRLNVLVANRR